MKQNKKIRIKPTHNPQISALDKYLKAVGRQHFGGGPIDGDCVNDRWTCNKPFNQPITSQFRIIRKFSIT